MISISRAMSGEGFMADLGEIGARWRAVYGYPVSEATAGLFLDIPGSTELAPSGVEHARADHRLPTVSSGQFA
jgi:hypothetical protein